MLPFRGIIPCRIFGSQAHLADGRSINMWVYGVEICFSPSASKNLNSVHPHIVSKGRGPTRGHAFNI